MTFPKQLLTLLFLSLACSLQAATPQRIISLVPSVTKNIYQLGAEAQLVGCTSFCTLAKPDDAQVVASAVQVNMEKALLLKPDLVVVGSLTPPETTQMFRKLGVEVMELPYPKSFNDICQQMLTLGEQIGKADEAKQRISEAKRKLAEAQKLIPAEKESFSAFMQIGANPLFGVVPNTFMNDFLSLAHLRNVAEKMQTGSLSREAILVSNPDYIFVVIMGSMGQDESRNWTKYSSLKAVQAKHIYELDADMACSPTPDDFVEVLTQIINIIYN